MNTALSRGLRARAWLAAALVALLASAGLPALSASADEAPRTVASGQADWGYKSSFRSYVGQQTAGMPALPEGERVTVTGGAEFAGEPSIPAVPETRPFTFPVTGGTVTDEANLDIVAEGSVLFHFPSHCFEAVVGSPHVVIVDGVATLRGQISVTTSSTSGTICGSYADETFGGEDIPLGNVGSATVRIDGDALTVTLTGITMSAEGSAAMQGFAAEGDPLDDLTLTAALDPVIPDPDTDDPGTGTPGTGGPGTPGPVAGDPALTHQLTAAELDWPIDVLQDAWAVVADGGAELVGETAVPGGIGVTSQEYGAYTKATGIRLVDGVGLYNTGTGAASIVFGGSVKFFPQWTYGASYADASWFQWSGLALSLESGTRGELTADLVTAESPQPVRVTLATVDIASLDLDAGVFVLQTAAPDYAGTVPVGTYFAGKDSAWPASFVDALPEAGGGKSYWYESNASSNPNKVPQAFSVTADATAPTAADIPVVDNELSWPISVLQDAWAVVASGVELVGATDVPAGTFASFSYDAYTKADGIRLVDGAGSYNPGSETGTISYGGSVRFYPQWTYGPATSGASWFEWQDVELQILSATRGTLTANLVTAASDTPVRVTLANFDIVSLTVASGEFALETAAPDYAGTVPVGTYFAGKDGAWPASFVDALPSAGGGKSYWYDTNASSNPDKVPQPFSVTTVSATPTSTALSVSPAGSALVGSTVTLSATVTPASEGQVRWYSNGSLVGTTALVAGSASFTLLAANAREYSFRADFSPADPGRFAASSSSSVALSVTAPVVAQPGSLSWGVKSDFRSYITGPIARGEIAVSGGASSSAGIVSFPQSAGSSADPESGSGATPYRGAVRFSGHGGDLDLSLSNPTVRFTSPARAVLVVTVGGNTGVTGTIDFATLDLGAAGKAVSGATTTFSNVPVTLTAQGATAFQNRYTTMDPLSFVVGSTNTSNGPSFITASARTDRVPAAEPPATTGITVPGGSLDDLKAGDEITIEAEGFEPSETGILVVIYSDPVVLARDVTADADGTATWTGRLPADLTGEHTLTLQGSVSRGIVLDIAPRIATAAKGCPVDDATLTWGFKESFRSYISGAIANGEWTVADGATYETPDFGWSAGTGAYDPETGLVAFEGSITFTGHGGILNTTVANPQLRFIDEDTAVLLLDVSGTTQDGAAIDSQSVEFVELDLSAATVEETDDALTVTGAPAVLTAAGSEAFGTYEAGEEFDPVSFVLPLDADCAAAPAPVEAQSGAGEPVSSDGPNLWWVWLIVALLVLAAAAVVVVVLRRRSRTA